MTCYNLKRFPNRVKSDRRNTFDKYTIVAPCGHCAACQKSKQNDWLVRGYFEYNSKPTTGFFVTLDFDEQHLPYYEDMPCFDAELMTSFFESLREVMPPFRYLYSCHLGEAMKRPHYHVLFFFDVGAISDLSFQSKILFYWKYGAHQDIKMLRSVGDNPFKAIEYVTRYTTRDVKSMREFRRRQVPARYCPRTIASIGFGAQAMDPNEFKSDRLISSGVKFLDKPVITRDYLLNNSLVYLDIRDDGILVPFRIPRYYELKLLYDYHYYPEDKKCELVKNSFGVERQKIKTNCDYFRVYEDFVNSTSLPIHKDSYVSLIFNHVFPESPYNGMVWSDVVADVLIHKDKFFDFCKVYDFIEFDCREYGFTRYRPLRYNSIHFPHKWYDLSGHYYKFSPCDLFHLNHTVDFVSDDYDFELYIQALSYFRIYSDIRSLRKGEYEDWKASESIKEKIKERCKTDISFYWHLRRHGFKFYSLNPSNYVSQYQIKTD